MHGGFPALGPLKPRTVRGVRRFCGFPEFVMFVT
jgi:hypothetical protein